ncbi:hypothetical protein Pcinc_012711 [Petrolisthes cinctipes]|uniref:Uncharacterized protein n=1 Tax=Petrolisthes cinctipes TaxID=88211 RepID=A0AAE1FYH6_PETCI|nr:hypothetical protein Pcinc_012711 [Petrolisthes cinctipes]
MEVEECQTEVEEGHYSGVEEYEMKVAYCNEVEVKEYEMVIEVEKCHIEGEECEMLRSRWIEVQECQAKVEEGHYSRVEGYNMEAVRLRNMRQCMVEV